MSISNKGRKIRCHLSKPKMTLASFKKGKELPKSIYYLPCLNIYTRRNIQCHLRKTQDDFFKKKKSKEFPKFAREIKYPIFRRAKYLDYRYLERLIQRNQRNL